MFMINLNIFFPSIRAKKYHNPLAQKLKPLKTWFQSHSKLLTAKTFRSDSQMGKRKVITQFNYKCCFCLYRSETVSQILKKKKRNSICSLAENGLKN